MSKYSKILVLNQTYLENSNDFLDECNRIDLSENEIKEYHDKGFLVVRNVINRNFAEELLALMKRENNFIGSHIYKLLISTFPSTSDHWVNHDLLVKLWFEETIVELIAQLQAKNYSNSGFNNKVRFLTDISIAFPKTADPKILLSWHADSTTFDMLDDDTVGTSVWIPLADINHSQGASVYFAPKNKMTEKCTPKMIYTPSEECDKEFDSIGEVHDYRMGDVVFFSRNTIHRTQPFKQTSPLTERFAIVGRYFDGDNAIYDDPFEGKPYTIRQPKTYCNHSFVKGDLITETPCWPQVYPNRIKNEEKLLIEGKVAFGSAYSFLNFETLVIVLKSVLGVGKIE